MPVYNLGKSPPDSHLVTHDVSAPLWGPNMMTVDGQEKNFGQTSGEMEVRGGMGVSIYVDCLQVFHAVGNISTVVRESY